MAWCVQFGYECHDLTVMLVPGWSEEEIEQGGVGGSGPCSGADIDEIYAQLFSQMRGGGGFGGFGRGNGFHRYSSYQ